MSTNDEKTMAPPEPPQERQAEWPAQPPPTYGAARNPGRHSSANLQWALLAIGAAVLIILVAVAGFGLGFVVGRGRKAQRVATNAPAAGGGTAGQLPGAQGQAGQRLQQLQQYLQTNDASLLRGKVDSVDSGSLTVETPQGKQTVAVTADTRYLGPGAGGAGGSASVKAGENVWMAVKKGADGKLQALAVRVGNAGGAAQPLPQQVPQQQQ